MPKGYKVYIGHGDDVFIISSRFFKFDGRGPTVKDAIIDFYVKVLKHNEFSPFGFWVGNINWVLGMEIEELKHDI